MLVCCSAREEEEAEKLGLTRVDRENKKRVIIYSYKSIVQAG